MSDRFKYAVEGFGDFPLDMLRHDCAYPADQESVAAIMAGLRWAASRKRSREMLLVRLLPGRAPPAGSRRPLWWAPPAAPPGAPKNGHPGATPAGPPAPLRSSP